MKKIESKELTLEGFEKYGSYKNLINPEGIKIGEVPIEFFRDLVSLKLGNSNIASIGVNRVSNRERRIDTSEYHNYTGEGIMPLDGDVLMYVAPASVEEEFPEDQVDVFKVPRGTFVVLNPGVWHHASYAIDSDYVNVLIILPERTYVNDCHVIELSNQLMID